MVIWYNFTLREQLDMDAHDSRAENVDPLGSVHSVASVVKMLYIIIKYNRLKGDC